MEVCTENLNLMSGVFMAKKIDPNKFIGLNLNNLKVIDFKEEIRGCRRRVIFICQCGCGETLKIEQYDYLKLKSNRCKTCLGSGELEQRQYASIKSGAESRNIPFEVSIKYLWELFLSQNRCCGISNVEIRLLVNQNDYGTASLDRIKSDIGYIEGNCQWVHKIINISKHRLSNESFISMCHSVSKSNNETNHDWKDCSVGNYRDISKNRILINGGDNKNKITNSITLTFEGRTQKLTEWARELDIDHATLRNRIKNNWSIEDAFTVPVNAPCGKSTLVTHNMETKTIEDWGVIFNIKPNCILQRLKRGISIEEALTTPVGKLAPRPVILLTIYSSTKTVAQWSYISGIDISTVKGRILAGWDHKKAVFTYPNEG